MDEMRLERRDFLRGFVGIGALGALPAPLLARALERDDWFHAASLLARLVPAKLPGLAAAIGRGTEAPTFVAIGTLARDSQTAVTPDTLWRVYSMTKPITGMAAMMLVEDGRLKLDQNIADFIPGFANPKVQLSPDTLESRPANGPITVRHLLTHTAGLGYTIVTKGPLLQEYLKLGLTPALLSRTSPLGENGAAPTAPSLAEFADRLATLPLIGDPGAKWSYSVSLDLLGRVIEVASGKPFDAFLQQRMFDPLGMKDTFWRVPEGEAGRFVTNYIVSPQGVQPVDPAPKSIYLDQPAFPFGGAGLVMSARDYDRFLAMLLGKGALNGARVMKPETVKLGMSNLMPEAAMAAGGFEGQGYGAGGRVVIKPMESGASIGTFGWAGAASTIGWVDPARGIRASGYAQYMPDRIYGFPGDFAKAVYADLV